MSEITLMFIGVAKLCMVLVVGLLYSMGGRDEFPKWFRRFLAPAVLMVTVIWFQFHWQFLLMYPILAIAYSLGYGRKYGKFAEMVIRTFTGLLIACAGIPIIMVTGAGELLAAQMLIAGVIHPVLGIFNPVTASQEELLIGTTTVMFVPFYV